MVTYPVISAFESGFGDGIIIAIHSSKTVRSVMCIDLSDARKIAAEITAACDQIDAKQAEAA